MTATLLKHACTHMHLCLCSQQQRHGLIQQSLKNLFSVVWCHLKVQSAVSVCLGVFRMDGNVLMKPPNLPVVDRIVTPGCLCVSCSRIASNTPATAERHGKGRRRTQPSVPLRAFFCSFITRRIDARLLESCLPGVWKDIEARRNCQPCWLEGCLNVTV